MLELNVTGMTCGHCVRTVTEAVKEVDPTAEVEVDLGSKRVRVESQRSAEELVRALGAAGYPARPAGAPAVAAGARKGCCGCG